jgi:hypothetical protein
MSPGTTDSDQPGRSLNNGVWYLNWGIILMTAVLGVIGLVTGSRTPAAPRATKQRR